MAKVLYGNGTEIVDPRTGEGYEFQPDSTHGEVDAAFSAAHEGWRNWRGTTPAERQIALIAFADAIESQSDQLVAIEQRNTGKTREQASDELSGALDEMRFMAGAQRALQGPLAGSYVPGTVSTSSRESLGVCAQILPWNYPLASAISKLAPALAMGNTSVLKPAVPTPCSVQALLAIASETLPPGVVNAVFGGRETGQYMVAHHIPALISLTGSVRAGHEITRAAGLKVLHLELGATARSSSSGTSMSKRSRTRLPRPHCTTRARIARPPPVSSLPPRWWTSSSQPSLGSSWPAGRYRWRPGNTWTGLLHYWPASPRRRVWNAADGVPTLPVCTWNRRW